MTSALVAAPWAIKGLCASNTLPVDPDTFFSDDQYSQSVIAQVICEKCPVKAECGTHALTYPEKYGVWGGMTERERHIILVKRKRKMCPMCRNTDISYSTSSLTQVCVACGVSWKCA